MDIEGYKRANVLRDEGKEEEALLKFEELARLEPIESERNDLIRNQANCLWRLGRLTEAKERLATAENAGVTPSGELLAAYICNSEGRAEEAERRLTTFLRSYAHLKDSEHQFIYFSAQHELGRLLCNLGRYAEAIPPLEEAFPLSGETVWRKWICFNLGVCYYVVGQWQLAIDTFPGGLPDDSRDPQWVETKYYLGICHSRIGKFELAEEELIQGISGRSGPDLARGQYELGYVYFRRGAYLKARREFEMAEFFVENDLKEDVSSWLAAVRAKLGEGSEPVS